MSSTKSLWILIMASSLIFFGCKKEVQMRTAIVTVVDEGGNFISSASVTVGVNSSHANTYVDPVVSNNEEAFIRVVTQTTNSAGMTTFEFERDCVFQSDVEKVYPDSTKRGTATLVFKQEAEFTKTIIIK